jgi:hypothetical protein
MSKSIISNNCKYTTEGKYECLENFGFDKAGNSHASSLEDVVDNQYVNCCWENECDQSKQCFKQPKASSTGGCNNCPNGWTEKNAFRKSPKRN